MRFVDSDAVVSEPFDRIVAFGEFYAGQGISNRDNLMEGRNKEG